jgi:hypothetical protein
MVYHHPGERARGAGLITTHNTGAMSQGGRERGWTVEGSCCKRPIQCLASSEILTPPPPSLPGGGGHTLAGWRRGGGSMVRKTPDTALYSIYVKYFVGWTKKGHLYARDFLMSSIWGGETLTKRFMSVNNRNSTGERYDNKVTYGYLLSGKL